MRLLALLNKLIDRMAGTLDIVGMNRTEQFV